MKREIIITDDGSSTIHIPDWNEQYHSKHGAIQEAYHVFIDHGLRHFYNNYLFSDHKDRSEPVRMSILEIGFGTGLNAFITLLESENMNVDIDYHGVEGYPVSLNEVEQLNYPKELKVEQKAGVFKKLHNISWNESHVITSEFSLTKHQKQFSEIREKDAFHLVYFDAFGARVQPELWTETIFSIMYDALISEGVLVTYSAKGSVRRAMETVGFTVERLPGPPGKREMLRATKPAISH